MKPIIRKRALRQIEKNKYFETPNRLTSRKCFYTLKALFLNNLECWITPRGHLQCVQMRYFVFVAFKLNIFLLQVTNSLPLNIAIFLKTRLGVQPILLQQQIFCPISLVYFQIRVIYQLSRQLPPKGYLVHQILFIYVVIGNVAIHTSHSYEELKHPICSSLCPHLLIHWNRIHPPAIMIIHAVLVAIVLIIDLRLEELGDCSQTGCMTKNGIATCFSYHCCLRYTWIKSHNQVL